MIKNPTTDGLTGKLKELLEVLFATQNYFLKDDILCGQSNLVL